MVTKISVAFQGPLGAQCPFCSFSYLPWVYTWSQILLSICYVLDIILGVENEKIEKGAQTTGQACLWTPVHLS